MLCDLDIVLNNRYYICLLISFTEEIRNISVWMESDEAVYLKREQNFLSENRRKVENSFFFHDDEASFDTDWATCPCLHVLLRCKM